MKFREEILAKIFTYITVIVLLGVVIFEAWSLQGERAALKEAKQDAESVHKNLDTMINLNVSLQEENRELQTFQNTWLPYAAFVESSEVMNLKTDLFVRPDLIPEQAQKDAARYLSENQQEESKEAEPKDEEEPEDEADEKEEERLEFQFDNPGGEDIFFPLSIDSANLQSCLVYTVAFEKTQDVSIELIYELTFEDGNSVVRDENGEVQWNCIAYNAGEGWQGTEGEKDDHD